MKPVVYIDVLFIINFIINYILLFTASKITKAKTSIVRMLLGALLGAVYAAIMFFPQIKMLYTFLSKLAVSLIITAVTFDIKSFKNFFKVLCVFYLTTFVFGGVAFALLYFTDIGYSMGTVLSNGIFYFNLPWKMLIVSTFAAYAVIHFAWKIYRQNAKRDFKNVSIYLSGKNISVRALVDTGNMLKDPLTQMPVMVAEYDCIKELFPDGSVFDEDNMESMTDGMALSTRFRLIPFKSLGVQNGMLVGFKPDSVVVDSVTISDIIVGIYKNSLSSNREYNALLSPDAVREAMT